MALRVLLADESLSIKKVMQLALQDFGVEVKAVPVGVDVISVAKSWGPDIFFVDVLLAKKNGYEVSADIKNDPILSKIPIVLMWSGFMDIDETKARQSRADRRLEKPFDADTLRNLVKDLVPKTKTNAIADYLTFPHLPDFIEKKPAATTPPPAPPAAPPSALRPPRPPVFNSEVISKENLETVELSPVDLNQVDLNAADMETDEPESFTQVPLPSYGSKKGFGDPLTFESQPTLDQNQNYNQNYNQNHNQNNNQQESWSSGDLARFKINIPKDDLMELESNMTDVMDSPIVLAGQGEVQLGDIGARSDLPPNLSSNPSNGLPAHSGGIAPHLIDPAVVEQVLREQIKLVLHDIAWKIIPDVVERIVKEEINKLLKDAEKLS